MAERILLLGKGGREHAFARKLSESSLCEHLYIAPGNPGTAWCGTNVALDPNHFDDIAAFVIQHQITMLVVGPEEPLVLGIWDYFQQRHLSHVRVIGPSANGAQLEGSKDFAKQFLIRNHIPTADYRTFTRDTKKEAVAFIQSFTTPVVLKADGLAAGKGVIICTDKQEAINTLDDFFDSGKFGTAGNKVVIESFLRGIELSVFILTDGKDYLILPTAKDYKRIGEGDTGLNTGGMGAISPVPFADDAFMKKIEDRVIKPTLRGLNEQQIAYTGFIYFGLIKVNDNPFVIEYNCRLGDPETEVVLPRIENDLVQLFIAATDNTLHEHTINQNKLHGVTIVVAASGYPGTPEKGKFISGMDQVRDAIVFQSGTTLADQLLISNGGRVLTITALGQDLSDARSKALQAVDTISFEGKCFRRDIGYEFF